MILLYSFSSLLIVAVLFSAIVLTNEVGFRLGRFVQRHTDEEVKSYTGSIQASILGLLALLLGFTFSMAMQRFDQRSMALIDEANAIGTVQLRVELLPAQMQPTAEKLLDTYLDLRLAVATLPMNEQDEQQSLLTQTSQLQQKLWQLVREAAEQDPRPVTTGMMITALNAMFDAQGKRNAVLHMQVPQIVLLVLFAVFTIAGGMMGYSAGLSGHRIIMPILLVALIITLIVFLIIDLDRPRQGIIQVDQHPMMALPRLSET
ncbi:DUF4239 domain-containing protein [Salinimonas marina]|uniref:DUF4239 domain-containing protein n=1 Tax=Salinimonas marina TaxID=2785918 RepID=A0A7S9HEG9_9ALTE|nr:DUF4239 domain-containing protein [Salinimonas marina]QPG06661.1 DUF4239 domain-containing protein [Salinimonas marina]